MLARNVRRGFGVIALILAVLAYYPSIAVFTPAIFLSLVALIGACIGIYSGLKRTSIFTIYIVFATFLVSPISSGLEQYIQLNLLIKLSIIIAIILAILLVTNYWSDRSKSINGI